MTVVDDRTAVTPVDGAPKDTADGKGKRKDKDKSKDKAEGKSGGGRKKLVLVAVLLLVVAGVGYMKFVRKPPPVGKPQAGRIVQLPTQTLNLSDGHLLQVGVAVQLTTVADPAVLSSVQPRLENIVLSKLAPFTYHQLLTSKGRSAAQHRVSVAIVKLVDSTAATSAKPKLQPGETEAMSAFFTTFLMQ